MTAESSPRSGVSEGVGIDSLLHGMTKASDGEGVDERATPRSAITTKVKRILGVSEINDA